ncbi:uncharacterized protein At5g50100, chloroplastic [Argentina anserina]|uniref:uncharacterized protein At5g50100, chloroplastic n=1 Tax=Argentina anserina TaxID=57926 RepID=UPI0021768572|nr:uncharacterized protein At5g50100, chloroplastic [Potentilla anserina]
MALRAVCFSIGGRQRSSCMLSVPRYLQLQPHLHHSAPRKLTSSPIHQSGFKFGIRAISEAAANPVAPSKGDERETAPENWKIKMLYDGDCPLCMREVNMLRERNKNYGTIKFVDISSEDYSPEDNMGLDYKTVMGNIHAILSDGTVVTDVEAFRKLYEQVGLGWVYAITKYEPIGTIAGAVYSVWAKYRLQITGRPPIEEVLELRKKNKGDVCNDRTDCKLPK